MRNLKRVLSLVLAAMMLIGMMVIGASAAVDKGDVSDGYNTAIDVAVAMGVITGDNNGVVNPTQALKRSEAAVMITRLVEGPEKAYAIADKYAAMTSSFTDSDGWSDGYINYCIENGYMAGRGNGIVDPNGPLLVEEFGIMLLRVLGYEDAYEGFTGANWDRAVQVKMIKLGLDLSGVNFGKQLTREQASQMVLQALEADMVTYSVSKAVDENGNPTGTTIYAPEEKKNTKEGDTDPVIDKDGVLQLGEKLGVSLKSGDVYGRPAAVWVVGDEEITDESSVSDAVYTTTAKVEEADVLKALDLKDNKGSINLYVDGEQAKDSPTVATIATKSGNGVQIEVYKHTAANAEDEVKFDVIVINTYVKVVEKDDVKDGVVTLDGDKKLTTKGYKEGDVVLYTFTKDGENYTLNSDKKATAKNGTITAVEAKSAYVRIDNSDPIYPTKNAPEALKLGESDLVAGKNITYYMDDYGYIAYAEKQKAIPVKDTYIYVVDEAFKAAGVTGGTDLFGTGGTSNDAQAQAKVIDLTTGKLSVVDLAVAKGTGANAGKWYLAKADGTADTTKAFDDLTKEEAKFTAGVYAYTVNEDGTYVIGAQYTDGNSPVTLTKGDPKIGETYYADDNTVVTVVVINEKKDGATITKVTGYKNFTGAEYKNVAAMIPGEVDKDTGVVDAITIVATTAEAKKAASLLAIYTGNTEKLDEEKTRYEFLVNGEKTYILDAAEAKLTDAAEGDVFVITLDSKEKDATIADAQKASDANVVTSVSAEIKAVTSAYISADKTYKLADNCVIYVVEDGVYTLADASEIPVGELGSNTLKLYGTEKAPDDKNAAELVIYTVSE